MRNLVKGWTAWKNPSLLLTGIGISYLGDWIYLIALNLMVLNMTNSPAAVAGLYILKPAAAILTAFWSGSIIDRTDKRRMMIYLDGTRALLVGCIPFFHSIWSIYAVVLIINMASSLFSPASSIYITKLIPQNERKRFNSLHNIMSSGAFLVGPGIAGLLFIVGSPVMAIYINALSFLASVGILYFLPRLDSIETNASKALSFKVLAADWKTVFTYSRRSKYIMVIYLLFNSVMVLSFALDSQEVVFTREVVHLSEISYGVLVSIAGAGVAVGSVINFTVVNRLHTRYLISAGTVLFSVGYVIYAFSTTFFAAAAGFFILAFFMSFASTGFSTFYQNNIPVEIMGRVHSVAGLFIAVVQIACTLVMGFSESWFTVKTLVLCGSGIMLALAVILMSITLMPSKQKYYRVDIKKSAA